MLSAFGHHKLPALAEGGVIEVIRHEENSPSGSQASLPGWAGPWLSELSCFSWS